MADMNKRAVEPDMLMKDYRELLDAGAVLPLTVSGGSMLPFLAPGRDTVYLKKIDRELKHGDMILYQRLNGQYILHRLHHIEGINCWFAGDAQDEIEGPLSRDCAIAYVESAQRKGKTEKPGTFWWDFFEGVWLHCVGKRQKILKAYGKLKR